MISIRLQLILILIVVAVWSIIDGIVNVRSILTRVMYIGCIWKGTIVDVWHVSKPTRYDRLISDFGNYPESYLGDSMGKNQDQNQF